MEDLIGVYGILDLDHWPNAPFLLLDGGVEKRWKEPYAFHNTDRGTYSGWLMQYTLSGTGWFEKNGKTYEMRPGRGFLCQIPENSRYYLHPESEEPWIFLYFHFRGSAVSYAAERLFEKTGDVFYADADSEPIRTALQMHRKLKNGYRSEPYECGVFLYQFFCSLLREVQRPERKQTHFFSHAVSSGSENSQSDDAALEYRKECGRDCSRNRIFQWKLFWKSIPSPYGNLAVGIPERTAERCCLKSWFCTKMYLRRNSGSMEEKREEQKEMERETFQSRLGFLLLSAGCAIGIGNVWKFPYMVGNNGGGIFVLFYLLFLAIMGVPILSMELAIGRGSKKSTVRAYGELEKKGQKWHIHGYVALIGNYLLMMFYTVVAGWMLYYFYSFLIGKFSGLTGDAVTGKFNEMLSSPSILVITMLIITIAGFLICSVGLQNGVERVTKVMMIVLMVIMIFLAVYSFTMPGAKEGLKFYLVPDMQQIEQVGLFHIITNAMSQAFFTLSLGIGAMLIFGSYLNGGKSLLGEAVSIAALDTFVAITAGLIIFPACFSYNVQPDSGPKLIFMTLPHIFTSMKGGRIFGSFFFLFLFFAALSTIIAVFENIMCCFSEIFGVSRKQSAIINCILVILGSLPCALGYNVWSGFQPLGAGSTVLDLEDFIVSNLLLPVGSLIYLLFCTSKWGWGFKNYQAEANKGGGLKVPDWVRVYLSYILPLLLLVLIVQGLIG